MLFFFSMEDNGRFIGFCKILQGEKFRKWDMNTYENRRIMYKIKCFAFMFYYYMQIVREVFVFCIIRIVSFSILLFLFEILNVY